MVQSITTKVLTLLNSFMNVFIKQLFTPNSVVAQLSEHKTEDLLPWFRIQGVLQKK